MIVLGVSVSVITVMTVAVLVCLQGLFRPGARPDRVF